MSGQKVSYARITTTEYNRLMRSASVAENMEHKIKKELNKRQVNLQSKFDAQIKITNQRNKKQEKIVANLNSSIKNMEQGFQSQYREQAQRHKRDINNLDRKIDSEVNYIHQKLDMQRQEYKMLIDEQSKILTTQIKSIEKSIKKKEQKQKDQAREWLKNAKDALALVDTYNHQKFTPNEYNNLQQKIELVESNIQNGNYEISNSQNIWMDAYKLRAKLEELENEWNSYLEASLSSNAELLATCEAQKVVQLAFDTEEETNSLEVDIDYWCNGELSHLKSKALEQQKLLESAENLEVKDFKKILEDSNILKEEVLALTQKAKEAIILSQLRSDMASDIVDSLDDSGFQLVDSCFEGEDERKAIHLKLENISGDEVVTIITPVENRENRLDIHFFDDNDESFKQTRLQSMIKRLNDNDVECQAPKCAKGTESHQRGDESVRDFDKVKKTLKGDR